MWQLPEMSALPKYHQIIHVIEEKLVSGELQPGERLPTERALADLFQVNRSTVKRAYEEFVANGIVIAEQGRGTYINPDKWFRYTGNQTNWHNYMKHSRFSLSVPFMDALKAKQREADPELLDFASGDLPVSLTPEIELPHLSWQTLLSEEANDAPSGYEPLRTVFAEQLSQRSNQALTSEHVLITSGAQQALFLITQGLLSPGDAIAIEAPSYSYSLSLFQSAGLRLYPLPMTDSEDWREQLETLYGKHRIKMVFVNPTYQNPTGKVMSHAARQRLVETCGKLHIPIVEDDPFGMLTPSSIQPLYSYAPDNVIYIGSLSKVVGATTRIGWLTAPPEVIKRLAEARNEMELGLSIFPQVLAYSLLKSNGFSQHVAHLMQQTTTLRQTFQKQLRLVFDEAIQFEPITGGYHLWVSLPDYVTTQREYNHLLKQNVLLMPGTLFGDSAKYFRLSFIHFTEERLLEAVLLLKKQLQELK